MPKAREWQWAQVATVSPSTVNVQMMRRTSPQKPQGRAGTL
jgi:hypothetical protein